MTGHVLNMLGWCILCGWPFPAGRTDTFDEGKCAPRQELFGEIELNESSLETLAQAMRALDQPIALKPTHIEREATMNETKAFTSQHAKIEDAPDSVREAFERICAEYPWAPRDVAAAFFLAGVDFATDKPEHQR